MIDDVVEPNGDKARQQDGPMLDRKPPENIPAHQDSSSYHSDEVETVELDDNNDDTQPYEPPEKPDEEKPPTTKNPFKRVAFWWSELSLKKKIILGICMLVVIFAAGSGSFLLLRSSPTKVIATVKNLPA